MGAEPGPDDGTRGLDELYRVSQVVLSVNRQMCVRDVLQVIVRSARSLAGARYAALGVPGPNGSFAEFIVDGICDREWRAIGPLPRQHGMLAVLLREAQPLRLADIRADPRFEGWPPAHPELSGFLGVPVKDGEKVLAIIFVANKAGPGRAAELPALGEDQDAALYRVAQEALHNALRHAGATRIGVTLSRTPRRVILEVTDDGSGFAPGAPGGLGFASMRGRAASAGGTLTIRSAPGAGTAVRLAVPLRRPARQQTSQRPGRPPGQQRGERTSGRAADAVGRAHGAARAAGAGARA